jgi:hypothetical protein
MDVEGFGDGADGFPLLDEFEGQFLLLTAKLTRTAEGDPAFAGVDETVLGALSDEGALELGQADARQLSALQFADVFLAAPEFTAAFGSNPSNNAFVTELYANVLGRAPDAGGLAYWEAWTKSGMAHDQPLVAFATSPKISSPPRLTPRMAIG